MQQIATRKVAAAAASSPSRLHLVVLGAILAAAALIRLGGLFHDLPVSYFGDELHLVRRAMAMGTGDLNPHWIHKPTFLIYLLLGVYGAFYVAGSLLGAFASPDAFGAFFLAEIGPFLLLGRLLVLAFGMASVVLVHRITLRVMDDRRAALAAAAAAAVVLPMVALSQVVKMDVPAACLLLAAVLAYLVAQEREGSGWLILAAVLAGLSAATKYYGVTLVPVIAVCESWRWWRGEIDGRRWLRRGLLAAAAFFGAFFVGSPFTFIDPSVRETFLGMAQTFALNEVAEWNPDSEVSWTYGIGAVPAATLFFLRQLIAPDALGWPFAALALAGILACLRQVRRRRAALILLGPVLVFLVPATTLWAFHVDARHLNAVVPLLLPFLYPGARLLTGSLRRAKGRLLAHALLAAAILPYALASVAHDAEIMRLDSRKVAADWIVREIAPDTRILLEDYGPFLSPGPQAVARLRTRLESLPVLDAFTVAQAKRLELLAAHPPRRHFNLDELGHVWWWPHELTEEEIRASARHRRQGNPLKSWLPKSLAAYRSDGYRYIVTNSKAQDYYSDPGAADAYPSITRFHAELKALTPTACFDPASWNGKGPVVWVYDLLSPPAEPGEGCPAG
ncbi:glycosyltransferase family 39 protein [Geminicoccaceae bacterium 1502E]|nr:glycosyltransferase family 39 protein [Geminicoccaceae bacterium 1502E]